MWTAVNFYFRKRCENADVRCQRQSHLSSGARAKIAGSNRLRMRVRCMISFYAFTSVFVWTGPKSEDVYSNKRFLEKKFLIGD